MKKIFKLMFGVAFMALIMLGCGSKETILSQDKNVSKIQMQFQDNIVECTDIEQIEIVNKMFEQGKNSINFDGKGWIYKLTFFNENDEEIIEIIVIDESTIEVGDKIYKCNDISLEILDEVSGIDRNNP